MISTIRRAALWALPALAAGCITIIDHTPLDGGALVDGGSQADGGHDAGRSDGGNPACTFGIDQTCNDTPGVNAFWGICNPDGTCTCHSPFVIDPATGRCEPVAVDAGGSGYCFSGGQWSAPDGGPASAGTCEGLSCGVGCRCVGIDQGGNTQAECDCAGLPDAGAFCVQPSCGPVDCDATTCLCQDAAAGQCWCPLTLGNDGGAAACRYGMDQDCNDNPYVNGLWGHCNQNGTCSCNNPFVVNPNSGKCASPNPPPCAGILSDGGAFCTLDYCPTGTVCSSFVKCDDAGSCSPFLQAPRDDLCHQPCAPANPACPSAQSCTQIPAVWDCRNNSVQWVCCGDGGC